MTPAAPSGPGLVSETASPNWTYLTAVMLLGIGALYTITCIGAIYGVPMLLTGLALWRAAEAANAWSVRGAPEDAVVSMAQFVRALRLYGIFMAVSFVVGLILLMVVFGLAALGATLAG